MALRVVGAGLGRTGTHSLKLALEQLLGQPCYHMVEVMQRAEHVPLWHGAIRGDMPDWGALMTGYAAAVDWPAAAFWRELADANPDAVILLSWRPAEEWWRSCQQTIFAVIDRRSRGGEEGGGPPGSESRWTEEMLERRFTPRWRDAREAMAAYQAHNDLVRRTADPARLVDYRVGSGWEPLCRALGVPVPDRPYPHSNTSAEFRERAKLE